MQATSSCLWYIRLRAWRRISPAMPKGRAVLCMQPERGILMLLANVCGLYDCAPGAASLLLCRGARGAMCAI